MNQIAHECEVIHPINIHLPSDMLDEDFTISCIVMDTEKCLGGDIDFLISQIKGEMHYEYFEVNKCLRTNDISIRCSHEPPPHNRPCVGGFSVGDDYEEWDFTEIIANPLNYGGKNARASS